MYELIGHLIGLIRMLFIDNSTLFFTKKYVRR